MWDSLRVNVVKAGDVSMIVHSPTMGKNRTPSDVDFMKGVEPADFSDATILWVDTHDVDSRSHLATRPVWDQVEYANIDHIKFVILFFSEGTELADQFKNKTVFFFPHMVIDEVAQIVAENFVEYLKSGMGCGEAFKRAYESIALVRENVPWKDGEFQRFEFESGIKRVGRATDPSDVYLEHEVVCVDCRDKLICSQRCRGRHLIPRDWLFRNKYTDRIAAGYFGVK